MVITTSMRVHTKLLLEHREFYGCSLMIASEVSGEKDVILALH